MRLLTVAAPARRGGSDIRTVQEPLGHTDVSTKMIDTHVLNRGRHGFRRRVDRIDPFPEPGAPSTETVYTLRDDLDNYAPDEAGAPPQLAPTRDPRPPVAPATMAL